MVSSGKAWLQHFSTEEIRDLRELSDLRGWATVLINYALIALSIALVAWAPHPFTIIFALFVIGARQLGLAVVMHESAHRTLFRNRASTIGSETGWPRTRSI
jgi:fatty acid desaturase